MLLRAITRFEADSSSRKPESSSYASVTNNQLSWKPKPESHQRVKEALNRAIAPPLPGDATAHGNQGCHDDAHALKSGLKRCHRVE